MPRMHIIDTVDKVFQGRLASYASQGHPISLQGGYAGGVPLRFCMISFNNQLLSDAEKPAHKLNLCLGRSYKGLHNQNRRKE